MAQNVADLYRERVHTREVERFRAAHQNILATHWNEFVSIGTSYLAKLQKKELSQISRSTRQKMIKNCENLRQGNSSHHERFHGKRANSSATKNDLKFVAIFR